MKVSRVSSAIHFLVLVALFALSMVATAAAASVTQTPNFNGQGYLPGQQLTISWTSQGLLPGQTLVLEHLLQTGPTQWMYVETVQGLPQNGSYTVTIPNELGSVHRYFIESYDWRIISNAARTWDLYIGNAPPVANYDTWTAYRDTATTIPISHMLANDTDPDGDPVTFLALGYVSPGATAVVVGTDVIFTPTPGHVGNEYLYYTVSDGRDHIGTSAVTVDVRVPPGALTGTITDARTHAPLTGATVRFPALSSIPPVVTDGSGGFSFTDIPAGDQVVRCSKDGYSSWDYLVGIVGGSTATRSFGLYPLAYPYSVTLSPSGIKLDFESVSYEGNPSASPVSPGHGAPSGFRTVGGTYFDITTDAVFTGGVLVTVPYDPLALSGARESELKLMHWKDPAGWEDVTVSRDAVNHTITGRVTSFSDFTIVAPTAPPVVVATPASSWGSLLALAALGIALLGWVLRTQPV